MATALRSAITLLFGIAIFVGLPLVGLGISLVYRSWLALILVAALTLVLLWRIHDEEAFMHQEFGIDWEAYSKRSWRLIPFVY